MADPLGTGTVAGVSAEGGAISQASTEWTPPESYHGRPVSWVAVSIIMAAFLAGGLALIFGPTWWVFWASVGLAAVGGLLALATHIFDDWY
jgi:hypothetical protein